MGIQIERLSHARWIIPTRFDHQRATRCSQALDRYPLPRKPMLSGRSKGLAKFKWSQIRRSSLLALRDIEQVIVLAGGSCNSMVESAVELGIVKPIPSDRHDRNGRDQTSSTVKSAQGQVHGS